MARGFSSVFGGDVYCAGEVSDSAGSFADFIAGEGAWANPVVAHLSINSLAPGSSLSQRLHIIHNLCLGRRSGEWVVGLLLPSVQFSQERCLQVGILR